MSSYLKAGVIAAAEQGIARLPRTDYDQLTAAELEALQEWFVRVRSHGYQGGQWVGTYATEADARTVAERIAAATSGTLHQDGHTITVSALGHIELALGRLQRAEQEADTAREALRREIAAAVAAGGTPKTLIAEVAGISRPTLDAWLS